jgi:hypothetical protein
MITLLLLHYNIRLLTSRISHLTSHFAYYSNILRYRNCRHQIHDVMMEKWKSLFIVSRYKYSVFYI